MKYVFPLFLIVILFSGKVSAQNTLARQIQIINARSRETAKLYEEQLRKINGRMMTVNENFSAINRNIAKLSDAVNALSKENAQLKLEINAMKKQLNAESSARQESLNKMADQMAAETARIVKSTSSRSSSGGGPKGSGDFYEYTVQKGATLSTIAKAYKVSVNDIRKANKLKKDMIYVGQKLYIPKQ